MIRLFYLMFALCMCTYFEYYVLQLLMGMNDGRVKAFNAHSAKFSGEMDCGHDYNQ